VDGLGLLSGEALTRFFDHFPLVLSLDGLLGAATRPARLPGWPAELRGRPTILSFAPDSIEQTPRGLLALVMHEVGHVVLGHVDEGAPPPGAQQEAEVAEFIAQLGIQEPPRVEERDNYRRLRSVEANLRRALVALGDLSIEEGLETRTRARATAKSRVEAALAELLMALSCYRVPVCTRSREGFVRTAVPPDDGSPSGRADTTRPIREAGAPPRLILGRMTSRHSCTDDTLIWNRTELRAFFTFVAARHEVFVRRIVWRRPPPWTSDVTLGSARFTNVFRQLDRHSRYLILNVFPHAARAPMDTLFNTLVFRTFNGAATYEALGGFRPAAAWDPDAACRTLQARQAHGEVAFTDRYSVSQQGADIEIRRLTRIRDQLPSLYGALMAARSLAEVHLWLVELPGVGGFTGYDLALDLTYAQIVPFTDDTYVVADPGAKLALDRLLAEPAGTVTAYTEAICALRRDQTAGFRAAGTVLLGPALTLANVQHSLCEYGKYARIREGGQVRERFHPARVDTDFRLWEPLPPEFHVPPRTAVLE